MHMASEIRSGTPNANWKSFANLVCVVRDGLGAGPGLQVPQLNFGVAGAGGKCCPVWMAAHAQNP